MGDFEYMEKSAEYYYNKGIVYYDEGKFNIAIDNFNSAISINPDRSEFYYNLGNSYFKKKEYDQAIEQYNKALSLKPVDINTFHNLGIIYSWKKEYELALDYYNKILPLIAEDADIYHEMGNVYLKKGEYDIAIDYYNKALKIHPCHLAVLESLADAQELKKADDLLKEKSNINEEVKIINLENPEEFFNLGVSYTKEKLYCFAIESFRKCLKIDQKYPKAYEFLNKLLEVANSAPVVENFEYCYNSGLAFLKKDQLDIAADMFKRAILINPNNSEVYFNLGLLYLKEKKYDNATENLTKCIEIDPGNTKARELIYKIFLQANSAK
jgi:tetratricopeptide (TPR) repeat protein